MLFVDDDTSSSELAEIVLRDHGAHVTTASSVDETLKLLRQLQHDVVVTDLALPGRDGFDLVRAVRRLSGRLGRVPLIALTAYVRADGAVQAQAAGFARYLAKPTSAPELIAVLCEVLGRDAAAPT